MDWATQIAELNARLEERLSAASLGTGSERRDLLQSLVGEICFATGQVDESFKELLKRGSMVGVDGSVNTYGGEPPHYIDFMRALAKPTTGEPVEVRAVYCPLADPDAFSEGAAPADYEARQAKLAELEVQAALASISKHKPTVILMDGPLVRFDMRAKESFNTLRETILKSGILLAGCIENIESRVIAEVAGDGAPIGWRGRYDRDLLWGLLEPGEFLAVRKPAKGYDGPRNGPAGRIRTWFTRFSLDPAVTGIDLLEEQVAQAPALMEFLLSITPKDSRGIPIWLDIIDRHVRMTVMEMGAYVDLLDPKWKVFLAPRRAQRPY